MAGYFEGFDLDKNEKVTLEEVMLPCLINYIILF